MNAKTLPALVIAGLLGIGCQSPQVQNDANLIVLPDGGPPTDAGNDTGAPDVGPPDAGDGTCGFASAGDRFPPLPASCLPMCDEATRAAIAACPPDAPPSCIWEAAPLHTGTIYTVDTALYGPMRVSCGGEGGTMPDVWPCYGWQATTCDDEFCHEELTTLSDCQYDTPGPCDAERAALVACEDASEEHQACMTERMRAC